MTLIRVAHSPDSDDAFMFYALAKNLIDTGRLEFDHVLADIETLNKRAFEGIYEVTAISIHALAYLDDRYALLASGASMGDGYGPVLVAKSEISREELPSRMIAIPGKLTSAALALKMWHPQVQTTIMDFDSIGPAVLSGEVDAGVIIHEGQLTWQQEGLVNLVDFGVWWAEETDGLPLPLGGNVIRRLVGVLALEARAADGGVDETRVALAQALDVEAESGQCGSAHVGDEYVCAVDHFQRQRAAVLLRQVDHHAALAAIVHFEGWIEGQVAADHLGEAARRIAHAGRLDLHHVRAPVGHDQPRGRAGHPDSQLHYPDALHRSCHLFSPCRRRRAACHVSTARLPQRRRRSGGCIPTRSQNIML